MSTCNTEATPELQLTSMEKHDVKKNMYMRKKKEYENNRIEKLEEPGNQHQTKQFYRDINKLRKGFKPRLTLCKIKNGDIITEKDDILNRWKNHFRELLNSRDYENEPSKTQDLNDIKEEDSLPTIEELEMAVHRLKNYKAPVTDNIPVELFKYVGNELKKHLHTVIKKI